MREIIFRGKRKDNGEWVYGNLIKNKDACFICPVMENSFLGFCYECDRPFYDDELHQIIPKTVGQFIGKYDFNNKKIYEDDITKNKFETICVVEYINVWGAYSESKKKGVNEGGEVVHYLAGRQTFVGNDWRESRIIGNIHDNPELVM